MSSLIDTYLTGTVTRIRETRSPLNEVTQTSATLPARVEKIDRTLFKDGGTDKAVTYTVFLRGNADIQYGDKLVIGGRQYTVEEIDTGNGWVDMFKKVLV